MDKCKYASRYKGKKEPVCGCDTCNLKWALEEIKRLKNGVAHLMYREKLRYED